MSSPQVNEAQKLLLLSNELEKYRQISGNYYFIEGKVGHGFQNGRKIDFPTANLTIEKEGEFLLNDGVYATKTEIDGKLLNSMTNIGTHPTKDELMKRNVETNILDFDGDLYDKKIKVYFCRFLRAQQKFGGLEELKEQLNKDKENVRNYFGV